VYHYENEVYNYHLTGITNRLGVRAATWEYDEVGRAVVSQLANNNQRLSIDYPDLESVYSGDIVQSTLTNSRGEQSIYTWQRPIGHTRPQLLSSSGVACNSCPQTGFDYTYDDAGRLLNRTHNKNGSAQGINNLRLVYDENGRVIERWSSDTHSKETLLERVEYDGLALQPSRRFTPSVNPDALQETQFARNENGLLVSVINKGFTPEVDDNGTTTGFSPIDRTTLYEYDQGRLVSIDGPRKDVQDISRFSWDGQNRMITMALPDSPLIRVTGFDDMGRANQFVRGAATPIAVSYNEANQIESITQLGRSLQMRYDAEGQLIGVVNRVGREMTLLYDDTGNLISVEQAGGNRLTHTYDNEGNIIEQSLMDRYGEMIRSVSALYDAQGRVATVSRTATIAGVPSTNPTVFDFEYDEHNRPTLATNRDNGVRLNVDYDATGNVIGMTGSNRTGFKLGYDAVNNLQRVSDIKGNTTALIRDDFNRVIAMTSADAGTSLYRYEDASLRPAQWTNPDSEVTTYTWDAANRPLQISNRDGDTRFNYDPATGLLAETSNASTVEQYAYNREGQLVSHKRIIDLRTFSTEYRYDELGRMTFRHLPDGQYLRYHYYQDGNLKGQLRAITRSTLFGLKQETLLAEIDEDASDGFTGFISHNGKRTTRTHAPDGRITKIDVTDTLALVYSYDDLGRITGIDENGIKQTFAYQNGHLNYASTIGGDYVFNYDTSGNRTEKQVIHPDGNREKKRYEYPSAGNGNRILAEADGVTDKLSELRYNNSGSPTVRGEFRYDYKRSRIQTIKNASHTSSMMAIKYQRSSREMIMQR